MRENVPVEGMSTGPPIEPVLPGTTDRPKEHPETPVVRRSPIVLIMALQFLVEGFLLLLYKIVPMLFAPGRHIRKTAPETLSHRSYLNREFPLPASFADVRKTKKVKSRRLSPTRLF